LVKIVLRERESAQEAVRRLRKILDRSGLSCRRPMSPKPWAKDMIVRRRSLFKGDNGLAFKSENFGDILLATGSPGYFLGPACRGIIGVGSGWTSDGLEAARRPGQRGDVTRGPTGAHGCRALLGLGLLTIIARCICSRRKRKKGQDFVGASVGYLAGIIQIQAGHRET
jgi:hypothetical protein